MDKNTLDRLEQILNQVNKVLGRTPAPVRQVLKLPASHNGAYTPPGTTGNTIPNPAVMGHVTPANGTPVPAAVSGRASIIFDRTKKGSLTQQQILDAINQADGGLTKKPDTSVKFAHLFVTTEAEDEGAPIFSVIGRVTLAMARMASPDLGFNTVNVAVAFCSDKDQYVRKVGRQISSGRLSKGPDFTFRVEKDAGSITEQARVALEEWLEECRECPRWITKQLNRDKPVLALFPSEL